MNKFRLEEYNQHSFEQAGIDKVILAIGSCECHGAHLPFGCDTFVSHQLGLDVAERLEGRRADTGRHRPVLRGDDADPLHHFLGAAG